jgi:hypothetical protein
MTNQYYLPNIELHKQNASATNAQTREHMHCIYNIRTFSPPPIVIPLHVQAGSEGTINNEPKTKKKTHDGFSLDDHL